MSSNWFQRAATLVVGGDEPSGVDNQSARVATGSSQAIAPCDGDIYSDGMKHE